MSKNPSHAPVEKSYVAVLSQVALTIRNQATFVSASHSCLDLSTYQQLQNCLKEEKRHSGVLWQEEFTEFRVVLCVFLTSYTGSVTLGRLLRLETPLITNVQKSW